MKDSEATATAEAEQKSATTSEVPGGSRDWLDAATVALRLGVTINTVRSWTNAGGLPAVRLNCGRRILYHWPDVKAALLRMQRGGGL